MIKHIIIYLFRASVAFYFIYPSVLSLRSGLSAFTSTPFFKCFASAYSFTPTTLSLFINITYIILGVLVLLWKRPLTPLILALLILIAQIVLVSSFTFSFMMIIIPVTLVTVGLTIYYSHHHEW
jgi:hypothetical protein